jgi:hypothetical protein
MAEFEAIKRLEGPAKGINLNPKELRKTKISSNGVSIQWSLIFMLMSGMGLLIMVVMSFVRDG